MRFLSSYCRYLLLTTLCLLYLSGCTVSDKPDTTFPPVEHEQLEPSTFESVNGWNTQQALGLQKTLIESCKIYTKRSGLIQADNPLFGSYEKWYPLCHKLSKLSEKNIQQFFESNFNVYQIAPHKTGLFTGYYIPHIKGSKTYSAKYNTPVLKTPHDLIQVNPKHFGVDTKDQKNKIIQGKIKDGWLVPYDDREEINKRLEKKDYKQEDIALWLENKIERFFLQIQGSGIIELENGNAVRLSYAARNGHDYYPIGRYLLRANKAKDGSMQGIKKWLHTHPKQRDQILYKNKLFIFFQESSDKTIRGAQNTPLMPEHSVAVDTNFIPLGTPLFIDTTLTVGKKPFQRAVTAQDVGSAIKGSVRADIFFGTGKEAGKLAGGQKAGGKMYAFIPK